MKRLLSLVVASISTLALVSCSQQPSGATSYTVPVAAIPGSSTPDLSLVMPDGSAAPLTGSTATFTADKSAGPATVGVMDTTRDFGWLAPYPAWFEATATTTGLHIAATQSETLGPLSTAVQMVFLSPGIYSTDPKVSVDIVKALKAVPQVQALADFLQQHASSQDPTSDAGFTTALNDAVSAGTTAVSALGSTSIQSSAPPLQQSLQPAALSSQAIVQDLAQTKINLSGDGIVPAWNIPTWERGLTWFGAIYKIDTSAYSSFGSLQSYATTPPNTTNLQLTKNPVVARIELPADAGIGWFKYDYFDWVSALTDAAMKGLVPLPSTPADTLLNNTGAYAIHLYTCGAGFAQGSAETANYKADVSLIDNWPDSTARWEWGASCVNSVLLSAMDIVSMAIKMNVSSSAGVDPSLLTSLEPIISNLASGTVESLTLQRFYDLVTKTGSAVLNWALTDGQVYLAKSAKNAGAKSQGKFIAKVLGRLNPLAVIANAANLGARLGSTANLTPWEGEVLVVGNPWSGPSIPGFKASPEPATAGESTTFTWSITGGSGTLTCTLDPGDGSTPITINDCANNTSQPYTYTSTTGSPYTATLTIQGTSVSKTTSVAVNPAPTNGLIAYYTFDNCDGTDGSGNGNTAYYGGTGAPTCTTGISGQALSLDGTEYMATNGAPTGLPTGGADRTITTWAYMTSGNNSNIDQPVAGYGTQADTQMFELQYGLGYTYVWGIWLFNCKYDVVVGSPTDVCNVTVGSPGDVQLGKWYFLAGTYDSTSQTTTLYVDGQQAGYRTNAINTGSSGFYIGQAPTSNPNVNAFQGAVDNVRLYNRVLSPAEIQSLYQNHQ